MPGYRVLHVEDSADDAALVAAALARSGTVESVERVEAEAEFAASIERSTPDVILCDYCLPCFSAERALELLGERGLDIPFIVLSHHIGRDEAVVALQRGATDYLSKGELGRLAKAIEHAVDRMRAGRGRALAERALRASEARLRAVLESLDSGIVVLDVAGRVRAANAAWRRRPPGWAAGESPDGGIGDDHLAALDAAGRGGCAAAAECAAAARAVMRGERPSATVDYRLEWPGGDHWFSTRITPFEGEDGGVVLAHHDVTDRMMAHAALESAHHRLEELSRRAVSIQEEERQAISRELHDDVGQSLAALKIGLHRLVSTPRDARLVAECAATASGVIERLRTMAQDLRPPQLDSLGLGDALRGLAQRHGAATGIEMACHLGGYDEERRPPGVEAACYRIAQEAINNATRHGRAQRITLTLEGDANLLVLAVRDDGVGFDEGAARARASKGSCLGLAGMEERARLAGGRLTVRSAPGDGTTVCALFPGGAAK